MPDDHRSITRCRGEHQCRGGRGETVILPDPSPTAHATGPIVPRNG